jgi:hypothetical protein
MSKSFALELHGERSEIDVGYPDNLMSLTNAKQRHNLIGLRGND